MIQDVGAAWMMVARAGSAQMVTLVQASITLPIVLLALIAGALADPFDQRMLMIAAQILMLVVSTVLAVCGSPIPTNSSSDARCSARPWVSPSWPSTWLVVTIVATFLRGLGWVLVVSLLNATVQMSAPRWVVARALSLYQLATFGGMASGAWL